VRDDARVDRRADRARRTLAALCGVLALGAGGAVSGCSSASPPSRPTGIDELTIPTPSPDPSDFVARVDNPWLPLAPGTTRTYELVGGGPSAVEGTVRVTVRDAAVEVDGVAATALERTDPDGSVTTDLYAQDRAGNVWWLGRAGVWEAGVDGAEAGLAVPAHPRVGDGWRPAYAEGVVEDVATVTSVDAETTGPAGTFGGLLEVETTSELPGTPQRRTLYAAGLGVVAVVGDDDLLRLLDAGPG
jgi:hypothetical protein